MKTTFGRFKAKPDEATADVGGLKVSSLGETTSGRLKAKPDEATAGVGG